MLTKKVIVQVTILSKLTYNNLIEHNDDNDLHHGNVLQLINEVVMYFFIDFFL